MKKKSTFLMLFVLLCTSALFSQTKRVVVDSLTGTNNVNPAHTVQLDGDNQLVLSITVTSANVWDLRNMRKIFTADGFFTDGCLGNDGKVYLNSETSLQCWDLAKSVKLKTVDITGYSKVKWYPDIKKILITDRNEVFLMDLDFNKSVAVTAGKAALSADGKRLAAISPEEDVITISAVDNLEITPALKIEQASRKLQSFSLSGNGEFLQGTYANSAICYNTKNGKVIVDKFLRYGVPIHQFSSGGDELFFADERADLFIKNLRTGKEVNIYDPRFDEYHQPAGYFFNYASSFAAGGAFSNSILVDRDLATGIYDKKTGAMQVLFMVGENTRGSNTIKHRSVFDGTGQRLICVSETGALRVFDIKGKLLSAKTLISSKTHLNLDSMYLTKDGKILVIGGGRYVFTCKL